MFKRTVTSPRGQWVNGLHLVSGLEASRTGTLTHSQAHPELNGVTVKIADKFQILAGPGVSTCVIDLNLIWQHHGMEIITGPLWGNPPVSSGCPDKWSEIQSSPLTGESSLSFTFVNTVMYWVRAISVRRYFCDFCISGISLHGGVSSKLISGLDSWVAPRNPTLWQGVPQTAIQNLSAWEPQAVNQWKPNNSLRYYTDWFLTILYTRQRWRLHSW